MNANGSLRFLSCLALQRIDQSWLGSNCQTFSKRYVLLVLLMAEATGFLFVSYTQLFAIPAVITIVIAGTRMYRALTYYGSTPPNTTYDILSLSMLAVLSHPSVPNSFNFPRSSRMVSGTKNSSIVQIPFNRLPLEVTVHKAYEEYPMSQMNRCGSIPAEMHS